MEMRICGVEITGSNAIFAIVQVDNETFNHLNIETKKIGLRDDEDAINIKSFSALIESFVKDNHIDLVAIKKRNKQGTFSGGAVTFKIETIFQFLENCTVQLISPQTIAAAHKRHHFVIPDSLNKYQHEAFLTACTAASRG